MNQRTRSDWRLILLAVGGGGAGVLAVGSALVGFAYGLLGPLISSTPAEPSEQVGVFVVLAALILLGALLLVAAFQAVRVLLGHASVQLTVGPLTIRGVVILLPVWLASSFAAQALINVDGWHWLLPLFHLLAISVPLYLLVRMAAGGLRGGSRLRLWGVLATGSLLATSIAAGAELGLFIVAASAVGLYLFLNPQQLLAAQDLIGALGQATEIDAAMEVLRPLLSEPLALVAVLVAVSVMAPLVEELAKSAAPWLLLDTFRAPSDGFWCGALSGAGFALLEGLVASADPSEAGAVIFVVRGWSSMMHVLASALAGWGIASWYIGHRAPRLLLGYGGAIGLHALWNAAVVVISFGGLRLAPPALDLDPLAVFGIALGGLTLLVLVVAMPIALVVFNLRLRRQAEAAVVTASPTYDASAGSPRS